MAYGAAILGEAALQLATGLDQRLLPALLIFMTPYKLATALGLVVAHRSRRITDSVGAATIALQWLAPLGMLWLAAGIDRSRLVRTNAAAL